MFSLAAGPATPLTHHLFYIALKSVVQDCCRSRWKFLPSHQSEVTQGSRVELPHVVFCDCLIFHFGVGEGFFRGDQPADAG